jgi:tRNA dimethylallyltransferase
MEISLENKTPVVVLAGATAVGKSALAIAVAKKLGAEIVSCDSEQVYKYLRIGVAKPSAEERESVPHHLIDFAEPDQEYTAGDFKRDCGAVIQKLLAAGKIPVLCGGTGFYIEAALYPMELGNAKTAPDIRADLQGLAAEKGNRAVFGILKEIDPLTAEKLHQNDLTRVIRAIEIYRVTGKTKSEQAEAYRQKPLYPAVCFAVLELDRELLYRRIDARVDGMIANGLVEEVKSLIAAGYGESPALRSIGYKEIAAYLRGEVSLQAAIAAVKQNTRRYAKRQITWFNAKEYALRLNAADGLEKNAELLLAAIGRLSR